MKTLNNDKAVTIMLFVGIVTLARNTCAQSTYSLNNYNPHVDAPVFAADGSRLAGSNFVAMLYGGPTMDALTQAVDLFQGRPLDPVPFTYMPNNQSGYFFSPGAAVIATVPCGTFAWLQVRAWDSRLAATYDEVAALGIGGYGESSIFRAVGGAPCLVPPSPPEPLIGLESFSLRAVPEPSTWALLVLGGLSFGWIVRRRAHEHN